MTVQTLPWSIHGQSHVAEVQRNAAAAAFGVPVAAHTAGVAVVTAGGGHGVIDAVDLAVTQNGTPNMSVNVAAGRAMIRNGESASILGACYSLLNDATVNVAISASDPTNPRIDLVIAQVRDSNYSGASNDARLTVVTGTAAASPSVPSLSSYPNCLVLAQVAVGAAVTTIVTANITDKRTRAYATGGVCVCTSTTRPTGASLHDGLEIFETDTKEYLVYYSAAAGWRRPWNMPWGVRGTPVALVTNNTTTSSSFADVASSSVSWTATGNRRIKVSMSGQIGSTVAGDQLDVAITDGSNNTIVGAYNDGGLPTASGGRPIALVGFFTPAAGAASVKLRIKRGSGSGTCFLGIVDGFVPTTLVVEDIGPSSATPA